MTKRSNFHVGDKIRVYICLDCGQPGGVDGRTLIYAAPRGGYVCGRNIKCERPVTAEEFERIKAMGRPWYIRLWRWIKGRVRWG